MILFFCYSSTTVDEESPEADMFMPAEGRDPEEELLEPELE